MQFNFKYHINDDNNMCLCKMCRMDRAIEKTNETQESNRQKRIERARNFVRGQNEDN